MSDLEHHACLWLVDISCKEVAENSTCFCWQTICHVSAEAYHAYTHFSHPRPDVMDLSQGIIMSSAVDHILFEIPLRSKLSHCSVLLVQVSVLLTFLLKRTRYSMCRSSLSSLTTSGLPPSADSCCLLKRRDLVISCEGLAFERNAHCNAQQFWKALNDMYGNQKYNAASCNINRLEMTEKQFTMCYELQSPLPNPASIRRLNAEQSYLWKTQMPDTGAYSIRWKLWPNTHK